MLVRDALYGTYELPAYLDQLLLAPEFRRLSEIRLININSVSLASLADVRRYSHTLGVLRLALLNPLIGLDEDQHKAFLASAIVHDAGTPAFAHLFEYFLADRFGWNHESVVAQLLTGAHHPDGHSHQIFSSLTLTFEKLCKHAGIKFDLVLDFIARRHPFSRLIFGSLDFDNLDNVARMNWMLGERFDLDPFLDLARNLGVAPDGRLQLPRGHADDVGVWQELRRKAYDVLVFDAPTVAAQAVLSKVLAEALSQSFIDPTDWHYDDRSLLDALMKKPALKKRLQSDFINELPQLCLLHVERGGLARFDSAGRDRLIRLVEEYVKSRFGGRSYGYIFRDRGTFEKRVDFVDPPTGQTWSVGQQSDSLLLYGFVKGRVREEADVVRAGGELREWIEARI